MTMIKKTITRLLSLALISLLLNACYTAPEKQDQQQTKPVTHIVMVWYKPDLPAEKRELIKQKTAELKNIPGLISLNMGEAIPSERPIVDDSFDLGIVMQFPNAKAMNTYLVHPQHKAFMKNYVKGNVEKLLVYDF